VCARYQDETIRNVRARRVQVDEIWQFVYAKAKNVPVEKQGQFGYGDVWTWVAQMQIPSWCCRSASGRATLERPTN